MKREFEEWALKKSDSLGLKIENLNWLQEFLPDWIDLSAKIQVEGKEYYGRGHSQSRDKALLKAIVEAIERAICLETLETTNGVAAHTELNKAKENAFNELIERDLFLSHFLTATAFEAIEDSIFSLPKTILDFVQNQNTAVLFYRMKQTNVGTGIVCMISHKSDWGCILGLSFGVDDIKDLCLKAFLEGFRQYYHLQYKSELGNNLSLDQFFKKESWNFNSHQSLSLNREYFDQISFLFKDSAVSPKGIVNYDIEKFIFNVLYSKRKLFDNIPLHIVSCIGNDVQTLTPGPFLPKNISTEGLLRFGEMLNEKMFKLPHPIN